MSADPAEDREEFEARAKAESWRCTRCGKAITFEDQEAYLEAKRCSRCHYEVDTESGTISSL